MPTFTRSFSVLGQDFPYTMVGVDPSLGGTTNVPFNILEVTWKLLNADGTVNQMVSPGSFETLTLNSPLFVDTDWASGHSQYTDGAARTNFFNNMNPSWHTEFSPVTVVDRVTLTVPFFINTQLPNGTIVQARTYFTGQAADGSTFILLLTPFFNVIFDNAFINEVNLGNFSSGALNMVFLPNTFLFNLNISNPNIPGGCCTLGAHTTLTSNQQTFVMLWSTWISPGIFGGGFQDIASVSMEAADAINDPFNTNSTPSWQIPGQQASSRLCETRLEVGNPTEVLANATSSVALNGNTYHPINLALLPWFEQLIPSDALNGAYSFPDPVLTKTAVPCPGTSGTGATSLGGTLTSITGPAAATNWDFSIVNSGPGVAAAAELTNFTVTQKSGAACTPVVNGATVGNGPLMPFPNVQLGDMASGASLSVSVSVNFTGCSPVSRFNISLGLSANGGATTGVVQRNNEFF